MLADKLLGVMCFIDDKLERARAPKRFDVFGVMRRQSRWAALHRDPEAFVDREIRAFKRDPVLYTLHAEGRLTALLMLRYLVWRFECWCIDHVVGFGVTA